MTKILIAYDGSEQSKRALRYAERAQPEDDVSVISVATAIIEGPHTPAFTDPSSAPHEHRRQLDEAVRILAGHGVAAEPLMGVGNPAEEILNQAEERGSDLIVMGRTGRNAVQRFLMGSVSGRVVQHAPCDVLVVR
jgi:nucleotide-binding universal stress UspA family protein